MSCKYSSTIAMLSMALGLTTGCDSLWFGFTKEDSSHCAAPGQEGRCAAPQICNVNSGFCEEPSDTFQPLIVNGLAPNQMPVLAGARAAVNGSGFQLGTSVMIGNQSLTNILTNSFNELSGIVPKAQGRCGKFDVTISRPDGQRVTIPGGFTYTLDPFYGKIPTNPVILPNMIHDIVTADFDLNQKPDIALSMGDKVAFFLDFGTSSQNQKPPLITSSTLIRTIHVSNRLNTYFTGIATLSEDKKNIGIFAINKTAGGYENYGAITNDGVVRFFITGDLDQNLSDGILTVVSNRAQPNLDNIYISRFSKTIGTEGSYQSPIAIRQAVPAIDSIIFANISSDKYPDIISSSGGKITIIKRDGSAGPELANYAASVKSLTSGDFNGDGKTDLAGIENITNRLIIALNNGGSNWNTITADAGIDSSSQVSLLTGEMNCDGKDDIVLMPAVDGFFSVVKIVSLGLNGQIEIKNTAQMLPSGHAVLGDFNNDAIPDITIGTNYQTGAGNVSGKFQYIPGAIP